MTDYQLNMLADHVPFFVQGNLLLAGLLFCLGAAGFFLKRNALSLFMCVELMINAANLVFVTFALLHQQIAGAIIVLFTITVAAAEAGIGLAIFIAMSRTQEGIDVSRTTLLGEDSSDGESGATAAPAPAAKAA